MGNPTLDLVDEGVRDRAPSLGVGMHAALAPMQPMRAEMPMPVRRAGTDSC